MPPKAKPPVADAPKTDAPETKPDAPAPTLDTTSPEFKDAVAKAVAEHLASNPSGAPAIVVNRKEPVDPLVGRALANGKEVLPGSKAYNAKLESTVPFLFPRDMILTLSDHSRLHFYKGIDNVPKSLVDDVWIARAGAKRVEAKKANAS